MKHLTKAELYGKVQELQSEKEQLKKQLILTQEKNEQRSKY